MWIKLADRGFSPVEVTLARLALGAAVLFAIVRVRREAIPRSGPLWVHIVVAALFANAVPYLLFAVAEQTVDSSTAGIINATTPLWTVVLALAVRHQKSVTGWQAAGLITGFAGAVLIFTPWHTAGGLFSAGGLECPARGSTAGTPAAARNARRPSAARPPAASSAPTPHTPSR